MNDLFIVLKFSDGDERFLYRQYASQADEWANIYKPNISYEMYCYDSEEDYFEEWNYE